MPLATYTGWALRSGVWANDGCESSGQFIPFAKTKADRTTSAGTDPRLSAAERYGSLGNYNFAVSSYVKKMIANRWLLTSDAASVISDAMTLGSSMLPLLPTP